MVRLLERNRSAGLDRLCEDLKTKLAEDQIRRLGAMRK
jgi:hypothetical protein